MAAETTIARESRVNPVNAQGRQRRTFGRLYPISDRTRSFMTSTGNLNDAILKRGYSLASRYANYSPFFRYPETDGQKRNAQRIESAVRRMLGRNRNSDNRRGVYYGT